MEIASLYTPENIHDNLQVAAKKAEEDADAETSRFRDGAWPRLC